MFNLNRMIAYEYAKAVFNIAIIQKQINTWRSTLKLCAEIIQDSLIRSLLYRRLDSKKLLKLFIAIYEDYQKRSVSFFDHNFIEIIIKNNRMLLLPIILEEFNALYCVYMKFVKVEVISARLLNDCQLRKINKIMEYRLSRKVQIVCSIRKDILAGIIIRVEDTVIDGSLMGRMLRLCNVLQS